MPIVYRCKCCGKVLYVFPYVGHESYGVKTPSEIISMYGGMCPYCFKPLERPTHEDVYAEANGVERFVEVIEEEYERGRLTRKEYEMIMLKIERKYGNVMGQHHHIQKTIGKRETLAKV